MLKGNIVKCSRAFHFDWSNVTTIELSDGKDYSWVVIDHEKGEHLIVDLGRKIIKMDDGTTLDGFVHGSYLENKAAQLISTIYSLFTTKMITQRERAYAFDQESDSMDEHTVDDIILPAFTQAEWEQIKKQFEVLRIRFTTAKARHFDNASGKYFMTELMKFCCSIDSDLKEYVSMGTSSSGTNQPGCSNLKHQWVAFQNERHASRSSSTAPGSTPAATPPPPSMANDLPESTHNIYSDTVYWNNVKKCYPINGEIKSGDLQSSENQLTEQMVGLFRAHQRFMLGYVIKPGYIKVNILERKEDTLRMHLFKEMPVDESHSFQKLCSLFIAFIYFVD